VTIRSWRAFRMMDEAMRRVARLPQGATQPIEENSMTRQSTEDTATGKLHEVKGAIRQKAG
jgi:hypothetical protein